MNTPISFHHNPVLLKETIAAINIDSDGFYVDCTAGGGGHSAEIASRLTTGKLIAVDRDPEAVAVLKERLGNFKCVTVEHDNFFNIKEIIKRNNIYKVNGILADLGVSSHQLDETSRGFSFHSDAPLDMRMSKEGASAADAVNTLSKEELSRILRVYGEEKFASPIASAIVRAREIKPIETTLELSNIVSSAVPAAVRREGHPARKTFQALRIYVNGELDGLEQAITDMMDCLLPGGRLCVISFHSLEDRIVKQAMQPFTKGCTCPKNFPVCVCGKKPAARLLKPVTPGSEEIQNNPRSRSAKLRVAEKLE